MNKVKGMIPLRVTYSICFGVLISILLIFSCDKNPTSIEEKERSFIPWDNINGKIIYRYTSLSSDNSVKSTEILLIDGDKKEVTSIAKDNSVSYNDLSLSADGEKIVYSYLNPEKGRYQLYELNLTSGEQKPIYQSDLHNTHPSWSKDGRLAYTGSWFNIWIDGTMFYQEGINGTPPSWSPDSKYLVASIRDSTSQGAIYKISLADTTATPLVQGTGSYNDEVFYHPAWSPDGSKIAYVKTSTIVHGAIWIMDADGSNQVALTRVPGDWHPTWSPDGESILFERNSQLFIISVDGSELTQITKSGSPFHARYPEWIQ